MSPFARLAVALLPLQVLLAASGGLRGALQNGTVVEDNSSDGAGSDLESVVDTSASNSSVWKAVADADEALIGMPDVGNSSGSLVEETAAWSRGGHHHHHHHHHHHQHHNHPVTGNLMTLYHTTSPAIAETILSSHFEPGTSGWCGGAIYFTNTPHLKSTKFGPDTRTGAVIQAKVNMGRMAEMDRRCSADFGRGISQAVRHGYDSLRFNPGDGDEFVILSASRVVSMRRFK